MLWIPARGRVTQVDHAGQGDRVGGLAVGADAVVDDGELVLGDVAPVGAVQQCVGDDVAPPISIGNVNLHATEVVFRACRVGASGIIARSVCLSRVPVGRPVDERVAWMDGIVEQLRLMFLLLHEPEHGVERDRAHPFVPRLLPCRSDRVGHERVGLEGRLGGRHRVFEREVGVYCPRRPKDRLVRVSIGVDRPHQAVDELLPLSNRAVCTGGHHDLGELFGPVRTIVVHVERSVASPIEVVEQAVDESSTHRRIRHEVGSERPEHTGRGIELERIGRGRIAERVA